MSVIEPARRAPTWRLVHHTKVASQRASLVLFALGALHTSGHALAQDSAAPVPIEAVLPVAPRDAVSQDSPPVPAPSGPQEQAPDVPRPSFALIGATVHSMVDGEEPFVATVLVVGGRIDAIGTDLVLPLGVERIDCAGKHIVPGLIDAMLSYDPEHDALYTASGITTVRDMGGDPDVLVELRTPPFRERTPGPFLTTAGGVIDGVPPISASSIVVRNAEDVERFIGLLAKIQVDFVSLMPTAPTALLDSIYAASAASGLPVWGMLPRGLTFADAASRGHAGFLGLDTFLPLDEATPEPVDRLDWSEVNPIAFRTWAKNFAATGAALVPVLAEGERNLTPRSSDDRNLDYLNFFYTAQWLTEWQRRKAVLEDPTVGPAFVERTHIADERRAQLLVALVGAGARVIPGSSAPLNWIMPGSSLLDELDAWVRAGLAPIDVLRAATATSADVLGLTGRGRIESGAVADLVVLTSDPRIDLVALRNPERVVVRGRPLSRTDLDGMLTNLAAVQGRARAENARPMLVEPPERIEGDIVLTGQVETRFLAERLSSERYAIVQRPDGSLAITSRLLQPPNGSFLGGEMSITQVLRNGLLESFLIRIERRTEPESTEPTAIEAASARPDVMIVRGLWSSERFSVERALNGKSLGTRSMIERPVAVTLDALADTVTCPLVLGQLARDGDVTLVTFGDLMEPVKLTWRIKDHPDGSRWAASEVGAVRFEYEPNGALVRGLYTTAGQSTSMASLQGSVRDFGGAGLPVVFTPPPAEVAPDVESPGTETPASDGRHQPSTGDEASGDGR